MGNDNLIINYDGDFEGGVGIAGPKLVVDNVVGIGTNTPLRRLHLYEGNGYCEALWEAGAVNSASVGRIWRWGTSPSGGFGVTALDGNLSNSIGVFSFLPNGTAAFSASVGFGTANPLATVHIRGSNPQNTYTYDTNVQEELRLNSSDNRPYDGAVLTLGGAWGPTAYIKSAAWEGSAGALVFGTRRSAADEIMQPAMLIAQNGDVGIGTTSPTHKLAVNGVVKAREVIVETTGWSDYVFDPDYPLLPLGEVEAHVRQHRHLPGLPSAREVAEQGISVGEMQARILAKVEELTLHVIAQQKEIESLKRENVQLISVLGDR